MNESVLANLPRFDMHPAPPTGGAGDAMPFDTGMDASGFAEEGFAQPGDIATDGADPAEFEITPADQQDMELSDAIAATLTSVSEALERIEAEAREQTLAVVQSMAESLFPKLSEEFLAEEIARHIPALIPVSAPAVEILARGDVAERLSQVIEQRGGLPDGVSVSAVENLEGGQVQVSWKTGGFDFDFAELLSACITQLNEP